MLQYDFYQHDQIEVGDRVIDVLGTDGFVEFQMGTVEAKEVCRYGVLYMVHYDHFPAGQRLA